MKYSIDYKLDEQKCTLCGICSEACDAFKIDFKEPTPLTVKKIGKLKLRREEVRRLQGLRRDLPGRRTCYRAEDHPGAQAHRQGRHQPGRLHHRAAGASRSAPVMRRRSPRSSRASSTLDTSKCPSGCSTCVDVCPCNALYLPLVEEAGHKPGRLAYNKDFCMYCGACVNACPADGPLKMKRSKVNCEGREDQPV